MFQLTLNRFLDDGVCKYADECGNTLYFRREEDGFVAKIRFCDKNVKSKPLYIKVPVKEGDDGWYLHLDYLNNAVPSEEVLSGIDGFTQIVNRWIAMLTCIKYVGIDNAFYMNADNKATENDIIRKKMSMISEYEELFPVFDAIFSNS